MNESERRELRVQVAVIHPHASLEEIQRALAHPGDEGWSVGDPWNCGSKDTKIKHARFSLWALSEHAGSLEGMDDAISRLRSRMGPIEARVTQLPAGSSICLRVFLNHDNGVFGLGWDADTVRWVASLGASIDVSVAVYQAD